MSDAALSPDDANQILTENFSPWVRDLHMDFTEITEGYTISRMPNSDRLSRVGGIVSGQALMAMADTTMVLATAGFFGEFKPVATTNFDMQFLRPGQGEWLVCRADIVRAGKSLAFVRAEIVAEPTGKQVARAQATFYVV